MEGITTVQLRRDLTDPVQLFRWGGVGSAQIPPHFPRDRRPKKSKGATVVEVILTEQLPKTPADLDELMGLTRQDAARIRDWDCLVVATGTRWERKGKSLALAIRMKNGEPEPVVVEVDPEGRVLHAPERYQYLASVTEERPAA